MKEIISNGQASQTALYSFEYSNVLIGSGMSGQYFDIAPGGYLKQKVSLTNALETVINYRLISEGSMKGLTTTIDAWDSSNSVFLIKEIENTSEEYKFSLDIVSAANHTIAIKNTTRRNIHLIFISALLEDGNTEVNQQVSSMSDKMILYGYEKDLPALTGGEITVQVL